RDAADGVAAVGAGLCPDLRAGDPNVDAGERRAGATVRDLTSDGAGCGLRRGADTTGENGKCGERRHAPSLSRYGVRRTRRRGEGTPLHMNFLPGRVMRQPRGTI